MDTANRITQEARSSPNPKKQARSAQVGRVRRCAHNLKTVVRKDLWVRVPRPPRNGPSELGFRISEVPLSSRRITVGKTVFAGSWALLARDIRSVLVGRSAPNAR